MSGMRLNVKRVRYILLFHVVVLSLWPCMWCVDEDEYSQTGNDALLPNVTEQVFKKLKNITTILIRDIEENLEFCIKDEVADWNGAFNFTGNLDFLTSCIKNTNEQVFKKLKNITTILIRDIEENLEFCIKDEVADWNGAFNFTGNLDFLTSCIKNTNGQVGKRMCTAGEIKFFFNNLFEMGSAVDMTYLEPNMNCNLTSWVSGCEPGWGCAVGQNKKVDLQGSDVPYRTHDCRPCCEGFFCPVGMTCMIPCPLGSYCPLSTLNEETGICEPYSYQPPPGNPNHTCGGAEIWADVTSSWKVFCSPGSYCPATTKIVACSSGHYCRMGSTSEQRCFKLASCNSESTNQNIRAYGVILIVVLSVLMLVVLYFSEQLLAIREKRNSKTREAAAKHVRETVQARDRWKSAKDVAKKSTEQFSRTFSRRKSTRQPEQPEVSGQLKQNIGGVSSPSMPPDPSSASKQPSTLSKEKKKEPSKLAKILHAIQDDSNSHEGFDVANGDKNIKNKAPKGKHLHTHSQIFKYAYGQIEKEKEMELQNKNLTFSGLIAMATDGGEIKTRPVIEIDFEDLTLTLKGKKKHILRCVTGKLRPGRVSAVMGPSGAGKTTFLSALAGKATGCTMSGSILINGKVESMHSYKKIIGFVPQDDIVHGNLTVEENLQFSARCRLSAEMPKPDKALVVERVIESLGLGAVRDSLVGTVEKRGISGGQRKRVNVGLEMVIEPSLLILDEPTTGLDSSSSQLLLRALRREALEGVNICMVVHQPSYALFKMFDDLVLLAKGGLTVYHGPVKKVEEYFSGLGISVPERVNPPDHFIDILEGVVKQDDSDVTHEQLPVKWMLHNGYPVPSDMLQYIDKAVSTSASASASSSASTKDDGTTIQLSFIRDLWWDIKFDCQLKREFIRHNFLKTKDLSHRITPGVVWQYRYFLGRVGKQRLREARTELIDFLILLIAGVCLGILAKVKDSSLGSSSYTFTVICVTLLSQVAALRSFSLDKVHYQRESASGISSLAHFLSKDTADLLNIAIKPLVFLSMFYFFNNPRSSFMANYIVLVCLVYCTTGVAYAFAIVLDPSPSQLWSALLPVVFTLVANQDKDSAVIKYFGYFCYPRFALQALVIANAERYHGVWLITRCKALLANGYSLHDWNMCLMVLMLTGIMCRSLAFLFMVTFLKK